MKIRYISILLLLIGSVAQAGPDDMTVSVWDPGCNHTMTTNHFVLAPNEGTHKIYIDLSGCSDEQIGSILFFGYNTTKTRSRQLSAKNKVHLYMSALDRYGNVVQEVSSASGAVLAEINGSSSRGCWLVARNNNRNKEIKIRLRAQLIAP